MENLYQQWTDSLQNIGINPLSGDTCCKLLAIIYIFGGGREEFTLSSKFQTDIQYAQKRLNILGGEVPDKELTPVLQNYIKELAPDGIQGEWFKPLWAVELVKKYDINL